MQKTFRIDFSDDRLLSIAADLVDEHNYIGALKMLNKNADITGNDEDSYMLYAEIFDDLGLYEKSVHHWFKYLDITRSEDLTECYEGLAVGYMNLGNDKFSAYYYNKLLLDTDDIDPEMREQIMGDFLAAEENPLKFVWPPELADESETIHRGLEFMKSGDFDSALEEFNGVAEGNPSWSAARNYSAMCHIVRDNTRMAEEECLKILEKAPCDIQALTTLAAVKSEAGKHDEAEALTRRLLALNVEEPDEIYKIATVCCENKLHEEAYKLFSKMDGDFKYDLNVLYFKAVSAFNAHKERESFDAFDQLNTVYPDAVTAQYWYGVARALREEDRWEELSYFYVLPREIRQSSLKMLAAFVKLPKKSAYKLADDINIMGPVKWCFDETDPSRTQELQLLALQAALKGGYDDYIRDALLHPALDDGLKIELLTGIGERNEDNAFGVVICNVYKKVTFRKIHVGRKCHSCFVTAYARLAAHFSILEDSFGEQFARSAETFYTKLESEERLSAAKDVDALTAVLFERSEVPGTGITNENLCSFFDVTAERLNILRGE